MRKAFFLLVLLGTGCCNAPIAGFLDTVSPSRVKTNEPPPPDVTPR